MLEIASGHPYVHSAGDADHPSHEALWDIALGAGADFMGVGVDDEHHIDVSSDPPATPGRAWISTFGDATDGAAICSAMAQGQLYASTGIELRRIAVRDREYEVEPVQAHTSVVFIGMGGRELARRKMLNDAQRFTFCAATRAMSALGSNCRMASAPGRQQCGSRTDARGN
ncbi:MAG: hypothetical protein WDO74_05190 [Pseudomonadota bacterium]